MATREEFLRQLWTDIINSSTHETWIENIIEEAERLPEAPFADLGPVLVRLLRLGASRRDLSLISSFASYEAVFGTLYMLDDPGIN